MRKREHAGQKDTPADVSDFCQMCENQTHFKQDIVEHQWPMSVVKGRL